VFIRSIFIFIVLACNLLAQDNQIFITFNELPDLLEQYSPQIKNIDAKRDLAKTERDIALQWTNPELTYDREHVKNDDSIVNEEMFYLSKTFSMPWVYWKERHMWGIDTIAAVLDHQYEKNKLLADTKHNYIRIGLLQKLKHQLTEIKDMLNELIETVEDRESEGIISPLDASLLSVSLFGLESDLLESELIYKQSMNRWKLSLGIKPSQELILTDSIEFKNVSIVFSQKQKIIERHPGLRAQFARRDLLEQKISLEKSRILPSFNLSAGYKRINQGWEGYILGLSLPLPLLNWNKPQVETQKINLQRQLSQSTIYKHGIENNFDYLISSIEARSKMLKKIQLRVLNKNMAEEILVAYQEGHMPLSDFLNAILIYRSSTKQYFEQLSTYYRNVFDLELLSGEQLVTF
jgi:outer membrane protein TolC